jgi:hypothetical protein
MTFRSHKWEARPLSTAVIGLGELDCHLLPRWSYLPFSFPKSLVCFSTTAPGAHASAQRSWDSRLLSLGHNLD